MKWVKVGLIILGLVILVLIGSGETTAAADIVRSIWDTVMSFLKNIGEFFRKLTA